MITSPASVFYNSMFLNNKFQKLEDFIEIYKGQKTNNLFSVKEIPFHELDKWKFINDEYLGHESGKFFKIEGLRISTNFGPINSWMQPIINQPEIGILGLITKVFDNTRYFLMQLKMEPGNINILQLSPTVQATKSNFSNVHKGKSVLFLEYFINKRFNPNVKILIDQLQSEQGGRFLRKRNRNMVVEVSEDIQIPENFFWLTLAEIKTLLQINNFVNMDARSVISTIPMLSKYDTAEFKDEEILQWYISQKVEYELSIEKVPLTHLQLDGWGRNSHRIFKNERLFSVIGISVQTGTREVSSWTQPMIKDLNIGLVGLIVKNFNNVPHYLVQTKVMPGNIDIIDMSPTVSVSNYNFVAYNAEVKPPFIEYFSHGIVKNKKILYSALQSEEGGRFYHLQSLNMIVQIEDNDNIEIPENYMWITKDQINKFMPYGMFNIEARSLISTFL